MGWWEEPRHPPAQSHAEALAAQKERSIRVGVRTADGVHVASAASAVSPRDARQQARQQAAASDSDDEGYDQGTGAEGDDDDGADSDAADGDSRDTSSLGAHSLRRGQIQEKKKKPKCGRGSSSSGDDDDGADSDSDEGDSRDTFPLGAHSLRGSKTQKTKKKPKRGRGSKHEKKKGKRGGKADILDLTRGNKTMAIREIQETRPQLQPPAGSRVFVTDEVATPVPPAGSNCCVLSGFALGRPAPSTPAIKAASLAVRNDGDVELTDIQAALTAEGSPLLLEPRTEIFFFSQLAADPIGMFIGHGLIQTPRRRR